jgi:hypothetical protein
MQNAASNLPEIMLMAPTECIMEFYQRLRTCRPNEQSICAIVHRGYCAGSCNAR